MRGNNTIYDDVRTITCPRNSNSLGPETSCLHMEVWSQAEAEGGRTILW